MLLNILILIAQAITKDGGISADYTLTVVVGILGILGMALLTFIYNSLISRMTSIDNNFALFQKDFHEFKNTQSALNAKFEERTKEK